MNDNERIAEWLGIDDDGVTCAYPRKSTDGGKTWHFSFDDITLWHGDDGLLAEIERRELIVPFIRSMVDNQGNFHAVTSCNLWGLVAATPAQLTAALVKMIEEASCTQEE